LLTNLPSNLRKLLAWLDRVSPLHEAQIVAAGLTLDKALMRNFAEMNLCEATVSITACGRDALSKFPVVRPRTGPGISEDVPASRLRLCASNRDRVPRASPHWSLRSTG
jgi:hypothetical protein